MSSQINKVLTNLNQEYPESFKEILKANLSFIGGGGEVTKSDFVYVPTITGDDNDKLHWTLTTTAAADPTQDVNVRGPAGSDGRSVYFDAPVAIPSDDDHPNGGVRYVNHYQDDDYKWQQYNVDVYHGKDGASGASGEQGDDGFTPAVSSEDITGTKEHPQGGTKFTFYWPEEAGKADYTATVWNGNDGKDWTGTTGRLLQGDFIKLTPTGDDLEISVTGDFVTSSTIVGTDQYALTTAGWAKVQGGGEGRTYLFNSDTLSGDGTEGNEVGVDTDALAGMYLPLSGTSEGKTISGNVVFENCHLTITNTGNAASYEAAATATNATDVFPFAMGAWIKRHEIGNANGNMAALGVVRADLIEDGFKASQDPNGCINYTSKTPVCMMQVGGDTNPWGGWATRLMFAQQVHSGTITDDTLRGWEDDNTLHFVLE